MDNPVTKSELIQFFTTFMDERGIPVAADDLESFHFRDSGHLDSFEILSMITLLEIDFGVRFASEELLDAKLATVGGIINAVIKKQ